MPEKTNGLEDIITVHITNKEFKQLIIETATKEINKNHTTGKFKPVLITPDDYQGFKITFLRIDNRRFAEAEPLDV